MSHKHSLKQFGHALSATALLLALITAGVVTASEYHYRVTAADKQTLDGQDARSSLTDAAHIRQELPQRTGSYSGWNSAEAPNYWRILGEAEQVIDVPAGEIWYSELDSLGRAGRAVGALNYELMRAGIARERSDMQSLRPSGWGHNERVEIEQPDGGWYHGYFWNRSHLIAKSLGGQDLLNNLICGTRMQNVGANNGQGGMAYAEGIARSWLEAHPTQTLFYSAQPIYEGDELVPRSIIVDLYADDGSLNMALEVYNCAQGYTIDYTSGGFAAQS